MTVFCVLSKHRGFNKHIWQAFHSWRAQDDTVCKQYARTGGKQVYSIIQLIDYSQDTCYPTMKNGTRTPRIRVGPKISNSRQYGIYRSPGWGQMLENGPTDHPNTHTHTHTDTFVTWFSVQWPSDFLETEKNGQFCTPEGRGSGVRGRIQQKKKEEKNSRHVSLGWRL